MAGTIISQLDFGQIKTELKNFLRGQTQFADYDYDGSNMSVILDILAYNTFMNNFYTNMALGEMFLDSAQLRSSIISHAKELNYLPRSYRSSSSKLTLELTTSDSPSFISIPRYTKFTSKVNDTTYTFTTDRVYNVLPDDNGEYIINDVIVYEGRIEKEYFDVTPSSKYVLSNKKIDTNSIRVNVYASNSPDAAVETYSYKANLFNVKSDDRVFFLQPAEKELYEVEFGNGVFGREPVTGEVVEISYRISSGEGANGARTFTPSGKINGIYSVTAVAQTISSGGAEQESLESIKFYAPKSIQVQDRAVTESDYTNLLKSNFSEVQAVSVQGGEELDPPQYGKVFVYVDVTNADGVSENDADRFKRFLKERSPLAIDPVVLSPKFLYVSIVTNVVYNTNISSITDSQVEAIVRDAINTYSITYLSDFKKNVRQSRLTRAIDDADVAIISNDTDLRMIIDFIPSIGINSNMVADFGNKLIIDHPLTTGENIAVHNPAIKTSPFTYLDNSAFIQDNGLGTLEVITNTNDGFVILNSNIGTVDYDSGRVIIRNLNVSSYVGSAIKIYGRPETLDILGTKDKITSIRDIDVIITVEASNA